MKPILYFLLLQLVLVASSCQIAEDSELAPPKITLIPEGGRVVATFDTSKEFFVDVMPLSGGRSFHPSFLVVNEASDNFSTESIHKLMNYYRKSAYIGNKRILLKSNHHLVLWNAIDRKLARGTVLQERHFSPEWKAYREEELVLIDQFIRTATKERVEVWINEGMNVANGPWRLMTPPVQFEVRGDAKALSKKASEIEAELNPVFNEARRAGKIPGLLPEVHGTADVILPRGWQNLESYPQKAEIRVNLEEGEDLLEYHYEKETSTSSWSLKHAWRVHGEGQRTRLKVTE